MKITVTRGFGAFGKRSRRRSKGGRTGQKSKFRAAAKACKGRKIGAFRACMKSHLRK